MLSVTGTVVNNGTTDTTTRYVLLTKDEAAPIVTLDADTFRADSATRSYTITGVTEPGATVWLGDPDQTDPEDSSPTANARGRIYPHRHSAGDRHRTVPAGGRHGRGGQQGQRRRAGDYSSRRVPTPRRA